jgi:hypothetical protein
MHTCNPEISTRKIYRCTHRTTFFLIAFFSINIARAQDIEAVVKSKPISVNGGISMSHIYHQSNRSKEYRPPYSFLLNGNINLKLFGIIDAPFTFLYSNAGSSYTQPSFNQTSLHPKYKNLQLHLGTLATSWSPYTVSGHIYNGVSVDFTPGKWILSGLYGRFVKAIDPNGTIDGNVLPAFQRNGHGLRLGYKHQSSSIEAIYFSTADQPGSISQPTLQSGITARGNQVSGFKWQQKLSKSIAMNAEAGLSAMQEDLRNPSVVGYYKAFKAGIMMGRGKRQWSANYERVDPGYRTLGAYFFNNDLENFTVGTSMAMLKNKIQLSGQAGLQRDNLNNKKWSRMVRQVGNFTLQIKPGKKSSIQGSWSNFLSYTNIRPYTDFQNQINPLLSWDTLNFRQISNNISANAGLELGNSKTKVNRLGFNVVRQTSADSRNEIMLNENIFYNAGFSYSRMNKTTGNSMSLTANAGRFFMDSINVHNFSPVLSIIRTFMGKKLRSNLSVCPTLSTTGNKLIRQTMNLRMNHAYSLNKHHQLAFTCFWQHSRPADGPSTRDLTLMLLYSAALQ